mmetsp:Transcript_4396/g.7343  ORF Transcript_4396/g.7343 Transcript_4396/m.7343 type:complete len:300 (+) Transcript_4396:1430-2329(+)
MMASTCKRKFLHATRNHASFTEIVGNPHWRNIQDTTIFLLAVLELAIIAHSIQTLLDRVMPIIAYRLILADAQKRLWCAINLQTFVAIFAIVVDFLNLKIEIEGQSLMQFEFGGSAMARLGAINEEVGEQNEHVLDVLLARHLLHVAFTNVLACRRHQRHILRHTEARLNALYFLAVMKLVNAIIDRFVHLANLFKALLERRQIWMLRGRQLNNLLQTQLVARNTLNRQDEKRLQRLTFAARTILLLLQKSAKVAVVLDEVGEGGAGCLMRVDVVLIHFQEGHKLQHGFTHFFVRDECR